MTLEELKGFCSTDPARQIIGTPWSFGLWTYATNGHVLVRVARIEGVRGSSNPKIEGTPVGRDLDSAPGEWFPLPSLPETVTCGTCNGTGRMLECPKCDGCGCRACDEDGQISKTRWAKLSKRSPPSDEPCSYCFGEGKVYMPKFLRIGCAAFAPHYIARLATLPGCEIAPTEELKQALFRFDGGRGLLMPMRVS